MKKKDKNNNRTVKISQILRRKSKKDEIKKRNYQTMVCKQQEANQTLRNYY